MTLVVFLIVLFNDFIVDALTTARKKDMVERIRFVESTIRLPKTLNIRWDINRLNEKVRTLSGGLGARITLIAPDGRVLADSNVEDASVMENHMYRREVRDAINRGTGTSVRYSSTLKTEMLYTTYPYPIGHTSPPYTIPYLKPLDSLPLPHSLSHPTPASLSPIPPTTIVI